MSKHPELPSSRLVSFGDARRQTNAPGEIGKRELEPPYEYFV